MALLWYGSAASYMKSKWQKEWIKYLWPGVIFVLCILEIKNKLALGESMCQENLVVQRMAPLPNVGNH